MEKDVYQKLMVSLTNEFITRCLKLIVFVNVQLLTMQMPTHVNCSALYHCGSKQLACHKGTTISHYFKTI